MKKQLLLTLGVLLLLTGWLSAFLLTSVPQQKSLFILGPTLLLGGGMGVVLKSVGGKLTAVTLALTALTALLTMNQLFPSRGVSISAFQKRMQGENVPGVTVPLRIHDSDKTVSDLRGQTLEAFSAVEVNLFAQLPAAPGRMAFDSQLQLFVTIPDLGAVYRLTDRDQDGFAEQPLLYYVGLDQPTGLAWSRSKLYVAEPSRVVELIDSDQDQQVDRERVLISGLPDDGGHWRRFLLSADNQLYLGIGSSCNLCEETDPLRAKVLRINAQTGEYAVFARGLRHVTGMAFSPDQQLWASEAGRTGLTADIATNEINLLQTGQDYGWPYCFGQQQADPSYAQPKPCGVTQAGIMQFSGDQIPQGLAFAGKDLAAAEDLSYLYVVLSGPKSRVIRFPYIAGRISLPAEPFLQGWESDQQAWGQPADIINGYDGCLYLGDRRANGIYRICGREGD